MTGNDRNPRSAKRRQSWDVLIVGAGPAGVSTWLHLHALAPELAARCLVIDRALFPRDKPCGGAITPLGTAILDGLDVTVSVPTVRAPAIEFRLGSQSHLFRHPAALHIVRRIEFDDALVRLAVARGMTLHEGEQFRGLSRARGRVAVRTDRDTYAARVVVAADGAQSAVRRAIQPTKRGRYARLLEVVSPSQMGDAELAREVAVFDFTAMTRGLQGYVWHFPCIVDGAPASTRGVFETRLPGRRKRADLRRILEDALTERRVETGARLTAHPIRIFDPLAGVSVANVICVGDAAGGDAALGEGIAHALDFGDLAANVVADAFDSADFSFRDYSARLIAHPVGRTLIGRLELATAMYESTATPTIRTLDLLARSLLPT
jgi:flavin-dependent dehydrogenase